MALIPVRVRGSTSVGTFTQRIRDILNVGTDLDSFLEAYIQDAMRFIESEHTFWWMDTFETITLDPADADGGRLLQSNVDGSIKEWIFARYFPDTALAVNDRKYTYLGLVDNAQIANIENGPPHFFFLAVTALQSGSPGDTTTIINPYEKWYTDTTPDKIYSVELSYSRFSEWPVLSTSFPSEIPRILLEAENLLLNQVILLTQGIHRDLGIDYQLFSQHRDMAMKQLLDRDFRIRQGSHALEEMQFK